MKIKIFLFFLILLWTAGIFIQFFIPGVNELFYALPFVERTYATVCHQQPEKLITVNGFHTLVCARCTGIYLGAFISSFAVLFLKIKNNLNLKYLLIAAVPLAGDVLLYSLGVYPYSKTVAAVTGFLLGSVGFLYIHEGIMNLLKQTNKRN